MHYRKQRCIYAGLAPAMLIIINIPVRPRIPGRQINNQWKCIDTAYTLLILCLIFFIFRCMNHGMIVIINKVKRLKGATTINDHLTHWCSQKSRYSTMVAAVLIDHSMSLFLLYAGLKIFLAMSLSISLSNWLTIFSLSFISFFYSSPSWAFCFSLFIMWFSSLLY